MTARQMCAFIVDVLAPRYPDGTPLTGIQVWEMSPTGELWPVFEMFDLACAFASPYPRNETAQAKQAYWMSRPGYEAICLKEYQDAAALGKSLCTVHRGKT